MLKFAIIRMVSDDRFRVILEGEDEELKDEIISKVTRILGKNKKVSDAISSAFDEYKSEFKERTVTLP
jgi:hypothetical protein